MASEILALVLPAHAASPSEARRALERLRAALDDSLFEDLRLVVTELVSNSVRHGPHRPITVKVALESPSRVRGEVVDAGDGTVAIREAADDGGRGLRIVDALARRWGVHEGSTHVWFELDAQGRAAA